MCLLFVYCILPVLTSTSMYQEIFRNFLRINVFSLSASDCMQHIDVNILVEAIITGLLRFICIAKINFLLSSACVCFFFRAPAFRAVFVDSGFSKWKSRAKWKACESTHIHGHRPNKYISAWESESIKRCLYTTIWFWLGVWECISVSCMFVNSHSYLWPRDKTNRLQNHLIFSLYIVFNLKIKKDGKTTTGKKSQ